MTKKAFFKTLLEAATAFYPPAALVKTGIEGLINRNDDPDDDIEEVTDKIGLIVVGAVRGIEDVKGKDYLHDPVLAFLLEDIKGDIRRYHERLKALKVQPVADATGVPV